MNEGWMDLRTAIIEKAIDDYKRMVKKSGDRYITGNGCYNILEIEKFFKSEYCTMLLSDVGITGRDILKELHEWRDEYLSNKQQPAAEVTTAEMEEHEEGF